MWFVYILLCGDGSFSFSKKNSPTVYTGVSNNLEKRLLEHKKGQGGRYTRSHQPIKLIYQERLPTLSKALKRESEIKSWTRTKKIAILKLIPP